MGPKKHKYPIEELLKIRETTKDTDEAVRRISNSEIGDQILKSINGTTLHSHQQYRSSSMTGNSFEELAPDDPNVRANKSRSRSGRFQKWSPTPSLRRGKAAQLLKEHGSPPGIRVTAGGRIVPDGLSPLASPRYEYSVNSGFACPYGYPGSSFAMPKPMNGVVMDPGNGMFVQAMDGEFRPMDNRNGMVQLYMPAPNFPFQPTMMPYGQMHPQPFPPSFLPQPAFGPVPPGFDPHPFAVADGMPTAREICAMEQFHSKLELELKELNKNEVLQRSSLNSSKRQEIVRARVELTQRLDESRRAISDTKKLVGSVHPTTQQQPGNESNTTEPLAIQSNLPQMNPPYNPAQEQFPPLMLHTNGFHDMQQRSLSGPHNFQPGMPEFVPRQFQTAPLQEIQAPNGQLQERAGKAGFGPANGFVQQQNSSGETVKGSGYQSSGGMGLDGSVHLPRRSHAVTIKDPNDTAAKDGNSLNPASPSYQPKSQVAASSDGQDDGPMSIYSMPSPAMIAEIDTIARSPPRQDQALNTPQNNGRNRSSSINTVDFFPINAQEHSAAVLQQRVDAGHMKHPSWMPHDGDPAPEPSKGQQTSSLPPNKSLFNDDSPADRYYMEKSAITATPTRSHHKESTVTKSESRVGSGSRFNSPKSKSYWEGYRTGIQRDIMPDNTLADFRFGYRDGLVQSSLSNSTLPPLLAQKPRAPRPSSPLAMFPDALSIERVEAIPSVCRSTSFPSFQAYSGLSKSIPGAPANSLATTPTQLRSVKKGSDSSFGTPTTRADFEPQPNILVVSGRIAGAQEPGNALSKRRMDPRVSPSKNSYISGMIQERGSSLDQQRYQKSTISVVQSNQHAHGVFPRQYDGSGDDDQPLPMSPSNLGPPTTPTRRAEDQARNLGSPVRRRAFQAVDTMKQLAGLGGKKDTQPQMKKEQDPAKMSSPEKKLWREKWCKNFRQLKQEEQKEIEEYKKTHPIH